MQSSSQLTASEQATLLTALQAVPEPDGLALIVVAGAAVLRRSRHRSQLS
jgi:MYXO-CTERM domain-containing protein